MRFLVAKLSESSGASTVTLGDGNNIRGPAREKPVDEGDTAQDENIINGLNDLNVKTQSAEDLDSITDNAEIMPEVSNITEIDFSSSECSSTAHHSHSIERAECPTKDAFRDQDNSQVNLCC